MSSSDINQNIRYRIYFWAASTTLLLALSAFISGHSNSGVTALIFSLLLAGNSIRLKKTNDSIENATLGIKPGGIFSQKELLTHIVMLLLTLVTLYSLINHPQLAEPWIYILPLLVYFIYPVNWGHYAVTCYSLILLYLLNLHYGGPAKVELRLNYLLCLSLALVFVFLREIRNKQIKPLRRTDNLTTASTREYLQDDLEKEILRSEREGTELTVLALAADPSSLENMETMDKDVLLSRLGHTLHALLRPFDGYYRLENDQFIIVLPHTHTRDGLKTAEKIRLKAREALSKNNKKITVSLGVAGLNVGDDPESISQKALNALESAQRRGNNCTKSFVDEINDMENSSL
jgi:diguanylate cyclase (GGDEF)-like protein